LTWEDGKKGNLGVAYTVSKKFAELAAWDFMEKEKPHFDLIALDAPGVFGFHTPLLFMGLTIVPLLRDLRL
jgi:hypothetical protein